MGSGRLQLAGDPVKPRPDIGTFDGIQSRLLAVKALILSIDESLISDSDREELELYRKALVGAVEYATPTEVCPYCFGRGDGCRFCGGIGYVSKAKAKLAPKELVDMAEVMGGNDD
jgi:hypothetical protein